MSVARGEDGGSEVVRLPQRTPFTMVDNPIIRAMTDYVALGMYLDMLSYPTGWRINIRELARTHKQGRQVLTDAMNDLIGRGLVFRLRYQESTGRWRTRTYVCSSPVTVGELRDIQDQYRSRCVIETSAELKRALDHQPTVVTTGSDRPETGTAETADPALDHDARPSRQGTSALVKPSTRFPAPGVPASGHPEAGTPVSSDLVPQRSESTRKKPPPPPAYRTRPEKHDPEEGDGLKQTPGMDIVDQPAPAHPDLAQVIEAITHAWPTLGGRDLDRLRPLVNEALSQLPTAQTVECLTANTGGARHPLALLRARLSNLPPPRRRRPATVWCGDCTSATYRWIQDTNGNPVRPCPYCSPQAVRRSSSAVPAHHEDHQR